MGAFHQRMLGLLVSFFVCVAGSVGPAQAQSSPDGYIQSEPESVRPGSRAYRFIRNFDHRYKCGTSTSSKKIQANKPLTRLEFVEVLQDCRAKMLEDPDIILEADAQAFDKAWGTRGFLAPFAGDTQYIIVDGQVVSPPEGYGETGSPRDDPSGEYYIFPSIDALKEDADKAAEAESEDPEFTEPDTSKEPETVTESGAAPGGEDETALLSMELPAEDGITTDPATDERQDQEATSDPATAEDLVNVPEDLGVATEEGDENVTIVVPPLIHTEPQKIELETFALQPIDTDRLVAEAMSHLENKETTVTADQIPLDLPHPACVRLPASEQAECFQLAAVVDRFTSTRQAQGQLACLERCESKRTSYGFDEWLVEAGRRTVDREYAARLGDQGAATAELDNLRQAIDVLTADIEQTARGRRVYVYENTNTGEIIQHFGNKFTPVAPLVYRGEGLLPLNETERQRLAEKRTRLAGLQADLSERLGKLASDGNLERWRNDALNVFWARPPAGFLSCTRAEFDKEYAACVSRCAGQTTIGDSSCNIRGVSYRSRAFDRAARMALYPPGHPMQTQPYSP